MELQRYTAPLSISEAVALLCAQERSFTLAGGTDLLVQMRGGARRPQSVIDLKRIPGMIGVEVHADGVRIGAATPFAMLTEHAALRDFWPGLVEAAGLIGSTQVQGRASLGGNLCNASPAADSVPALIANRVHVVVAGPAGRREAAVESICRGPGQTALGDGEFVLAFELPKPAPRSADAYLRFIPRTEMDIAVVGAAAAVTVDEDGRCSAARVAIGAVAPTALLVPEAADALLGSRFDAAALEACIKAVRAAARPISDRRGTAEFRRHVVGVMTRRAVLSAAQRASTRTNKE